MTKKTFIFRILLSVALLILLAYTWNVKFKFDTNSDYGLKFGSVHVVFNLILMVGMCIIFINALYLSLKNGDWDFMTEIEAKQRRELAIERGETPNFFDFSFSPSMFKIFLLAMLGVLIYQVSGAVSGSKKMYNTSIVYHNNYTQTVQEKQGFYENLWNSWAEQKTITSLNKDVFIEVSKIIMENRKDGDKLAWKWVQETQHIPFSEFTSFYSNLSEFIRSERSEYLKIENKCQKIANENNTLLDTFPNNVYNKVIGCKKIKFEYGFESEKPTKIFTLKTK